MNTHNAAKTKNGEKDMTKAEELVQEAMTRINCIRAREIHGNISPEILAEIILVTVEQSIEHGRRQPVRWTDEKPVEGGAWRNTIEGLPEGDLDNV